MKTGSLFLSTAPAAALGCILACSTAPEGAGTVPVRTVANEGGPTIAFAATSGLRLVGDGGFHFKDLNRNGALDAYEDWRRPAGARAKDLASRMSIPEIAGLMLYSNHQAVPAAGDTYGAATYGGKPFAESGARASDLTDQQREFLSRDNLRHILITSVESPAVAAAWNNNVQALCESMGLGIPANTSSDPRHQTAADAEYNAGAGGPISMWPGSLGLAATFDPELVREFGRIASREYRALGITTALWPQIDLATDPRWSRVSGTFGESPALAADMARACVDGLQTSEGTLEISGGWGYSSVNAMVKHWPGGGTGEGGRDAHFAYGKYAVYPGNRFADHLLAFTEGAFKLDGKTRSASAVMPYYTISYGIDTAYNENVGNSYSAYMIRDLLRGTYAYDGVVCTDWGVTRDVRAVDGFGTTPWGAETLTEAERHYRILAAGVDQFGGNNDAGPVVEAYDMGVRLHGEAFMRARMEASAERLLRNMFRVGLFENPYLDIGETRAVVGNPAFMKAGYRAQLQSVVMLKNSGGALPVARGATVYVPERITPAGRDFFGGATPESRGLPVDAGIARKYYRLTDAPDEADAALVVIESPDTGGGYDPADARSGGTGYVPISLQYGPYRAGDARDPSIAGGDPLEAFSNRSYRGKSTVARNIGDLRMVLDAARAMQGKPVVVVLRMSNPTVFGEFEPSADAILVSFGVQDQALLDILSGEAEPAGLLPLDMPADMRAVEAQAEDRPFDMDRYVDAAGNAYGFGFGLDWSGVIRDARTAAYEKEKNPARPQPGP